MCGVIYNHYILSEVCGFSALRSLWTIKCTVDCFVSFL